MISFALRYPPTERIVTTRPKAYEAAYDAYAYAEQEKVRGRFSRDSKRNLSREDKVETDARPIEAFPVDASVLSIPRETLRRFNGACDISGARAEGIPSNGEPVILRLPRG